MAAVSRQRRDGVLGTRAREDQTWAQEYCVSKLRAEINLISTLGDGEGAARTCCAHVQLPATIAKGHQQHLQQTAIMSIRTAIAAGIPYLQPSSLDRPSPAVHLLAERSISQRFVHHPEFVLELPLTQITTVLAADSELHQRRDQTNCSKPAALLLVLPPELDFSFAVIVCVTFTSTRENMHLDELRADLIRGTLPPPIASMFGLRLGVDPVVGGGWFYYGTASRHMAGYS
ncbi:hypothetical protein G7K_2206-t1 [Saitoella complicata NRRL Y-17804]|uniref:Uncharacterized protein n=1 Tax=Saitoella complicata (strain BCRC 22490 / CBS 7301 / JCM 7358 / NBRC 10748 / NRRL Y-17804) TaxID=698492 RepID=A0A0E9NDY4_SAICN|nr:hypothetical protein G7K_2206-t1 [Saitoella complicata NRRL Y-17804]